MRVLCADDDPIWSNILRKRLPRWGYEPILVSDGGTAVDILCADDGPSLALVDWMMPGCSGVELCRIVRANVSCRYVYIIVVTGRGEADDVVEGLGAGADDYLVKPASPAELERRLSSGRRVITLERSLVSSRAKLEAEMLDRERAERELRRVQKLEAVAQLAAGIAHEINTPAQFVGDSIEFLGTCLEELAGVVGEYRSFAETLRGDERFAPSVAALDEREQQADVEFLLDEGPRAVQRAADGVNRIAEIVRAMQGFAPTSRREPKPCDLRQIVHDVLIIARSEYRSLADVDVHVSESVVVNACASEIGQALLALVVNAAYAIKQRIVRGDYQRGRIDVHLRRGAGEGVTIEVTDDGCGMASSTLERIFDPFFTTKGVGEGSGQGLPLAHRVIVEDHGGRMAVHSELGVGTTFTILLPEASAQDSDPSSRSVA